MKSDELLVRRIVSEINAELSNIMRLRDEYNEFINKYKNVDKYLLRVKANQSSKVLKALEPYLENANVANENALVRACYRYITNHSEHLDYKGALAANLPIGSGEIESGHRYIIQERLKISGAWWKIENAKSMLALRMCRENNNWESYWADINKKAA